MNNILKKFASTVALAAFAISLVPGAVSAATIVNGDLVKKAGDSAVYLIQDGKARVIPHSAVYHSWGFPSNFSTVKTVTAAEMAAYPVSDPVPFRDGYMFRGAATNIAGFATEAVFFVSDGKIRPIESANTYMKLVNNGVYSSTAWNHVTWVPSDLLSKFVYPAGTLITETSVDNGQLPNGMVVKGATDGLYYVVSNGQLRNVTSSAFAANKFSTANTFTVAQSKLNAIQAGAPITSVETTLNTPKFFVQEETNVALAKKLLVTATPASLVADGTTQVTITATVATEAGATVTTATSPVTFAITSGAGTLSASTVNAVNGLATVKLTPSAVAGTITVSATATGLTAGTTTVTTTVNSQAPQISSVSNSGMRLINVVFDRTVDKTSAETTSNYTPKNNKGTSFSVTSAKLLADSKTVQLFLADELFNDGLEDSIEIKNVQDSSQLYTMTTITKTFTVSDSSVPTVTAVEALGSRAVRVTFSEAIKDSTTNASGVGLAVTSFRMDDKTLAIPAGDDTSTTLSRVSVTYPDGGDYTKALINFGNGLAVGAHTLTVGVNNSLTDYNVTTTGANNFYTMQAAGYVATVAVDTSVPTLSSVEVVSQTRVRYTFSKAVQTPSNNSLFYSTANNATSGTFANSVTKVSDSVYEATWSSAIPTGTIYFYAGTSGTNVSDYSGNNISPLPSSRSASVASDTAPTISSVSMDTDSDRIVVVMFSKDVDEASAETTSNYVFKTSTGTVLTSTTGGTGIGSSGNPISSPVKDATNAKKITITLGTASQDANALPGGTYQLCVANVKATSASTSSAMPSSCYTFTVTDKTRPTLYNASASDNGFNSTAISAADAGATEAGRIVVKFSEAMGSSALNAQNYKVRGVTGYATDTKLSDISGVSLSFRNSNKDVVIDFPNSIDLSGASVLTIGYKNEAGVDYSPTDAAGNSVKDPTSATLPASIVGGTFTAETINVVTTGLDISDASALDGDAADLVTLKIKSATTFEATFGRNIEAISASEFLVDNIASSSDFQPTSAIICTAANYTNSASTGCSEENEAKVIFTIPGGSSYEFTAADSNFTFKTQASTLSTTKDVLGLLVQNAKTSAATATNDIKPVLKSFVLVDSNTLVITFNGKIEGTGYDGTVNNQPNEALLANDLIISQTVGTTTTTLTGGDLGVTIGGDVAPTGTSWDDSTVVYVNLQNGKTLSILDKVTVKTVASSSIDTLGANGAYIAADTTGLENATFVASSFAEGLSTVGTGYGSTGETIADNDTLTVVFSAKVDRTSIDSGTWTDAGSNVYTKAGISATYNGSTNKLTINGIGDFEFTELYVGDGVGTSSTTATADLSLNTTTNTLTITLQNPSQAYYATGDTITYVPSSGIRSIDATNNAISTTFKPVDIAD